MSELGHCLVTGAGGFIGSHLVEELCRRGTDVTALVRYTSRGHRGWLTELDHEYQDQVEVVLGDVRDPDQMRVCLEGCDTVFHLAALIGIPYSYVSPRQNFETNVLGTLNVLEGARIAGVRRLIHTSTSEVYGTAQYVPIDENHPLVGQSPYAASKIAADQLTLSYARSFELPAVIVRPFNTFGPRQSMRAVIPTIVTQALWSDRIRLGALQTTRDFTFVRDTAAGFIQAALASGVEGEVFNLGHGEHISIEELVDLVRGLVDRDLPIEREDVRLRPPASEVERLVSDATGARQRLGWEPTTSLGDGLRQTVDWIATRGPERLTEGFAV
jgi:NAD dependent epimerase/dehydratase